MLHAGCQNSLVHYSSAAVGYNSAAVTLGTALWYRYPLVEWSTETAASTSTHVDRQTIRCKLGRHLLIVLFQSDVCARVCVHVCVHVCV